MIRNFIFVESITIVFLILMLLSLAEAGGGGLADFILHRKERKKELKKYIIINK